MADQIARLTRTVVVSLVGITALTAPLIAQRGGGPNAGGGVLKPVIVVGGEVVGSWQRTIAKGRAVIKPTLFKRLDRAGWDAIDKTAINYGRFLGLAAEVARG